MNIENLKRAIEYVKNIDPENLRMNMYRGWTDDEKNPECESVGCVIGHCTALDSKNIMKNFINRENDRIDFENWSEHFFGFSDDTNEWHFMFHGLWGNLSENFSHNEMTTPNHAAYRMQKILDGYKPGKIDKEIEKEYHLIINS